MKKIGTKIVTVLAACAALVLASCAQPSTSGSGSKTEVETGAALTKTSILSGVQTGENVWGSGTNIVASGSEFTVTAGTGWDSSGSATIPVIVAAGDLVGFTHIVIEIDVSAMALRDDSAEYPQMEVIFKSDDDSKSKTLNVTSMYDATKKEIVVPISSVDFLSKVTKFQIGFRGTGSATLKDVSKAK